MATLLSAVHEPTGACTQQITAALDPEFLALLRWDWDLRIVFYPKSHPVLGMPDCQVKGCQRGSSRNGPLCDGCLRRHSQSGQALEDFLATATRSGRAVGIGELSCEVTGCARPAKGTRVALCATHYDQQTRALRVPLEEFLAHPAVRPLDGFGMCQVAACHRRRSGRKHPYCAPHAHLLARLVRSGTFGGDEEAWRRTARAIVTDREVSLRGLPLRVVAELLYTLQVRTAKEVRTRDYYLRPLCDQLRAGHSPSLEAFTEAHGAKVSAQTRSILAVALPALKRLGTTPETERHHDVWDLAVFGHSGRLDFTGLHQRPMREAMKVWAYDDLPRRRGKDVRGSCQMTITAMALLSESLRLQRPDAGHTPQLLGRTDIVGFLNRLAFLVDEGKLSAYARLKAVRNVRSALIRIRSLGLTRPGEFLEGLPQDFIVIPEDVPDELEDTEAGKDLPDEVMRQLCNHLDLLEQIGTREVRVATELLIDTGRRPDEIHKLPWDCLQTDPDGSLVLLYDNSKEYRLGRRLPIGKETAAVITEQQKRVRTRFPHTPVSELKLLPAGRANPEGKKSMSAIQWAHRQWVLALPEIVVPVVVEVGGQPGTRMLAFDKDKIFPYAYRHSYAQRHADAGVAPDVLKALMDHRQLKTTLGYYRVGEERRREAVNRVVALQFDRHGNRVWRKAQGLMDSEHVRRAIGEVATAYGLCKEPSNVAAGGQSCPLRFRCLGCEHFHTDVSYLPDLEAYLADLLRSREKLMSTFEADDWARSEAMPSEEEIRRVRRLINRVKADLDDLNAEDRAQIEQAVSMVRRGRTVMLGMPRVGQPLPDVRPWRSA
ncbi:tyrosine-type recombinase/integrase [Streptomyces sp. LZ34]